MTTTWINSPHKPSCAILCSDEEERRPCDCGAVTQPRLTLSLGLQSVELLFKAVGRLDGDEQRVAAGLGLVDALAEFVLATRPLPLEERIRELLTKKNMREDHPLPFIDVAAVIARALAVSMEPEEGGTPDEAPLGVASFGRFDDHGGLKHVFVLVLADKTWVTIGISSGSTRWAEAGSFWPELQMTSNRWSEHRKRYVKWIATTASDRWSVPRTEAEKLVAEVAAHGTRQ